MENKVIAVVAGEEITQELFDTFLQGVPREQQMYLSDPQFREQCFEQLVALFLFAKKGEEEKIDETEEFQKIFANAKRELMAQFAIRNLFKEVAVSDEEIKVYYDESQAQFKKGETVSAKHILVDSEEKCNEILASITNGAKSFEDAAKESSTCPSGQRGGDLGAFGKGQMVPEFEQAAFEAEIGQVVGPVQTQFGFHLIKVEAKNEAEVAAFAEVKENIKRNLIQQKQNSAYDEKVAELKAKYMEV